nr:DUF6443 domain-containing protein [uncultured Acetobacteroides sp.]
MKSIDALRSLPVPRQGATVSYVDGLGRTDHTVAVAAIDSSETYLDLVSFNRYDDMGRESMQFLPFSQDSRKGEYVDNILQKQSSFYLFRYGASAKPYSEVRYDGSPLNIPVEQSAPGDGLSMGNGHTVTMKNGVNASNEVPIWELDNAGKPKISRYYSPNNLLRIEAKDPDGIVSVTYKTIDGLTVRSVKDYNGLNATTDYVYDDLNRLVWVLPPEFVKRYLDSGGAVSSGELNGSNELSSPSSSTYKLMPTASMTLKPGFVGQPGFSVSFGTGDIYANYAYSYRYDNFGRIACKKLPGVDSIYMAYDSYDRLAATQDGSLRAKGKWLYSRYDDKNRVVETGFVTNGITNQLAMQAKLDNVYGSGGYPLFDSQNGDAYTTNSYPKPADGTLEPIKYTFYETYNVPSCPSYDVTLSYRKKDDVVVGLATVTRFKNLGTNEWNIAASYYDREGHVIQSVETGILEAGVSKKLVLSTQYNFAGGVTNTRETQQVAGLTNTLEKRFEYNDNGSLKNTYVKFNSGAEENVASYTYDRLGNVREKVYGGTSQKDSCKYDINGRLIQVNSPDYQSSTSLFAYRLGFDKPDKVGSAAPTAQYGGSISSMVWRSQNTGGVKQKKGYGFSYDGLDRLKATSYGDGETLSAKDYYVERNLSYDLNGNIAGLTRTNGSGAASTYSNSYIGNMLRSVNNGAAYCYDANGNATTDGKNGYKLAYNELNLPSTVSTSAGTLAITYKYDADAEMLLTKTPNGYVRYYVGSMVYEKQTSTSAIAFSLAQHSEGVVLASGIYSYYLKDHLGNVRVVFHKAGNGTLVVDQATDYYPFGKSFDNVNPNINRYLYNGKELQDQMVGSVPFGYYNFGARFYDPELGLWHSVDNASEKFSGLSPYNYCMNNPLVFIDPDGNNPLLIAAIIIGAAAGGYTGHKIAHANGYNFSNWQTYGYMLGGAVIGGFSGYAGVAISTGGFMANTMGAMYSSMSYSLGMSMLSGGRMQPSISLGGASYNFGTQDWGYIGEKGNSKLENLGYGLGMLANLSDVANFTDSFTHWEDKMRAKYEKGYGDAVCYKDETIGNNIGFGSKGNRTSFSGPNNPSGLNAIGDVVDYYGPVPNGTFLEYPGFIHDVSYAKLGIQGANGLFTSLRALPADIRFISQSLYLGTKHLFSNPWLSFQSDLIGIGLGAAAAPKAIILPSLIYGTCKIIKR